MAKYYTNKRKELFQVISEDAEQQDIRELPFKGSYPATILLNTTTQKFVSVLKNQLELEYTPYFSDLTGPTTEELHAKCLEYFRDNLRQEDVQFKDLDHPSVSLASKHLVKHFEDFYFKDKVVHPDMTKIFESFAFYFVMNWFVLRDKKKEKDG